MRLTRLLPIVGLFCAIAGWAQSDPPAPPTQPPAAPAGSSASPGPSTPVQPTPDAEQTPKEDKRIFGVIPNNRTTEASIPFERRTAKQKMAIAVKDSFDWPVYPTAALFATLYQLENSNPSFGQGVEGWAKRFGTAYGDQMIGNMMTEGIVPSLFHHDPRYFRIDPALGYGRWHRALLSIEQIVVCRTDNNHKTFNISEWGGNAVATAISNAYYPDTRDVSDNVQKWLIAVATDTFSNILKEFWPDVKNHFKKKGKHDPEPLVSTGHP